MHAVVTGATGLIGRALIRQIGSPVAVLSRDDGRAQRLLGGVAAHRWAPEGGPAPVEALRGADVVFNLAGEPAADGRWTAEKKRRIRDSRVVGTRHLVAGLAGRHAARQIRGISRVVPVRLFKYDQEAMHLHPVFSFAPTQAFSPQERLRADHRRRRGERPGHPRSAGRADPRSRRRSAPRRPPALQPRFCRSRPGQRRGERLDRPPGGIDELRLRQDRVGVKSSLLLMGLEPISTDRSLSPEQDRPRRLVPAVMVHGQDARPVPAVQTEEAIRRIAEDVVAHN